MCKCRPSDYKKATICRYVLHQCIGSSSPSWFCCHFRSPSQSESYQYPARRFPTLHFQREFGHFGSRLKFFFSPREILKLSSASRVWENSLKLSTKAYNHSYLRNVNFIWRVFELRDVIIKIRKLDEHKF